MTCVVCSSAGNRELAVSTVTWRAAGPIHTAALLYTNTGLSVFLAHYSPQEMLTFFFPPDDQSRYFDMQVAWLQQGSKCYSHMKNFFILSSCCHGHGHSRFFFFFSYSISQFRRVELAEGGSTGHGIVQHTPLSRF